jgi:hypothetical protein
LGAAVAIDPYEKDPKSLRFVLSLRRLDSFVFGKDCLLAEIADEVKGHSEGDEILEKEQTQITHVPHPVNPRY